MADLLQGGKKRRRASKGAAALAIVLAPLAVGVAAWLTLHDKGKHSGPSVPVATHALRYHGAAARRRHHPKPVPVVRMSSVDAFGFRFHKPPLAAMLVDLDNGDVLWRL